MVIIVWLIYWVKMNEIFILLFLSIIAFEPILRSVHLNEKYTNLQAIFTNKHYLSYCRVSSLDILWVEVVVIKGLCEVKQTIFERMNFIR